MSDMADDSGSNGHGAASPKLAASSSAPTLGQQGQVVAIAPTSPWGLWQLVLYREDLRKKAKDDMNGCRVKFAYNCGFVLSRSDFDRIQLTLEWLENNHWTQADVPSFWKSSATFKPFSETVTEKPALREGEDGKKHWEVYYHWGNPYSKHLRDTDGHVKEITWQFNLHLKIEDRPDVPELMSTIERLFGYFWDGIKQEEVWVMFHEWGNQAKCALFKKGGWTKGKTKYDDDEKKRCSWDVNNNKVGGGEANRYYLKQAHAKREVLYAWLKQQPRAREPIYR
jgi:hypothetical protein